MQQAKPTFILQVMKVRQGPRDSGTEVELEVLSHTY